MQTLKKCCTYLVIALISMVGALNYELFVFPNQFAPAGLNGLCTMVQYVTGVSVGYLNLLINLPLAYLTYKMVSKSMALRSMVYVLVFSLSLLILDHVDLSGISYSTENGTSKILGPLTAGIIMGYCYSVLIKASAYTGGTDFISALIHKYYPEKSVMSLTFTLNAVVAGASYFVYDHQVEPVLLCILYCFASTTMAERAVRNGRSAVRFEIVTNQPEALGQEILQKLHHTATVYPATGLYSGKNLSVIVCVVNNRQMMVLADIIRKYPNTFATVGHVNQVMGRFRNLTKSGKEVVEILDQGDAQEQ